MNASSWLRRVANGVRTRVRSANAATESGDASSAANRRMQSQMWAPRWFRRQSAGDRAKWARRALDWPLVNYLEAAVWLGVAITLGVSYYGSYGNLVVVLMALGYEYGPAHVVPAGLDAPLSVSVIGQFLLGRWKSPPLRRWRLFAVTLITAPLSLAGNALRGAVVVDAQGQGRLELALLDLHRPEVWIRLIAAMVPSIGVILAVAVTELVLREHARLEELREAAAARDADDAAEGWTADRASATGERPDSLAGHGRRGARVRSAERAASRRPASEVLELVRAARDHLAAELGRKPSDQEIAARMTADGNKIAASRVRFYLPKLRPEERSGPASEEPAEEEVVAWHAR